jgi:hypothetical protein
MRSTMRREACSLFAVLDLENINQNVRYYDSHDRGDIEK